MPEHDLIVELFERHGIASTLVIAAYWIEHLQVNQAQA